MSLTLTLAALAATLSPADAAAASVPPIAAARFGLYVVTDDLDRAATFYERLFGKPEIRVPGMAGFNVAGGLLSVVDRKSFGLVAVPGDTMRGYIKVPDIHAALRTAAAATPVEGRVTTEGRFSFFRVRDPDGNLIEFYAVATE